MCTNRHQCDQVTCSVVTVFLGFIEIKRWCSEKYAITVNFVNSFLLMTTQPAFDNHMHSV